MILPMIRLWNHFLCPLAGTLQRRNYPWDSAKAIVTMMMNVCPIFIASYGTEIKRFQAVEVAFWMAPKQTIVCTTKRIGWENARGTVQGMSIVHQDFIAFSAMPFNRPQDVLTTRSGLEMKQMSVSQCHMANFWTMEEVHRSNENHLENAKATVTGMRTVKKG